MLPPSIPPWQGGKKGGVAFLGTASSGVERGDRHLGEGGFVNAERVGVGGGPLFQGGVGRSPTYIVAEGSRLKACSTVAGGKSASGGRRRRIGFTPKPVRPCRGRRPSRDDCSTHSGSAGWLGVWFRGRRSPAANWPAATIV